MVRPGRHDEREGAAIAEGLAIVGWAELDDLSKIQTRGELRDLVATTYAGRRTAVLANWTGQLWRFTRLITVGDLIIVPRRSREQLAIGRVTSGYEYRADQPDGFRHVVRVRWTRTDLRRDLVLPDLRASMGSLQTVFELRRHDAVNRIAHLAEHGSDPGDPGSEPLGLSREELLTQATGEDAPPVRITIRELLGRWGAGRRTADVVATIESDLTESGLTTRPPFTEGWLNQVVELIRVTTEPEPEDEPDSEDHDDTVTAEELPPVSLRIGDLSAANQAVCAVHANDPLVVATTHMLNHDYSQLAVHDGTGVVRAVSWESIAKAGLANRNATLTHATVPARVVDHDASLLSHVQDIYRLGYVLVRGADGAISGIVTTADLTMEFANMARPTALIAEIERRLRRRVDEVFTLDEIRGASNWSAGKVSSAADLTLGNYEMKLLKPPQNFARLQWHLDHTLFLASLGKVRKVRNDLAHFSTTDPLTPEELSSVEGLLNMLRIVDARP